MRLERAIKNVFGKEENKKVKKFTTILALTMTFVLVFAMSAFAAQELDKTTTPATTKATPAGTTMQDPTLYSETNNTDWNNISSYSASQNTPGAADGKFSTAPNAQVPMGVNGATTQAVTRIHSNYAQNTNACAACHATHTAVGKDLLQWSGETETCMACHDGSAGVATYNVSGGQIGTSAVPTNGGVFPQAAGNTSKSMHDVFGGITINAAPGGNFADTTSFLANSKNADWANEFSCVSCHSPHGNGGNFRILDPNANGFAQQHLVALTTPVTDVSDGTKGFKASELGYKKYAVKVQFPDYNGNNQFWAYLLQGPYPIAIKTFSDAAGTVPVTATFSVENDATVITVADTVNSLYVKGNVALKVKGNIDGYLTASETVQYVNGFNDFCGACHTDYDTSTLQSNRAFPTPVVSQLVDANGRGSLYLDAAGTIPYLAATHAVDAKTGTYSKAYRHTVGFSTDGHGGDVVGLKFEERKIYTTDDNGVKPGASGYDPITGNKVVKFMSCMTCHVAHGTDDAWWVAYGTPFKTLTTAYGDGTTPSEVFDTTNATTGKVNSRGSNLKRMPNMGACEACHAKGAGNAGYSIQNNAY